MKCNGDCINCKHSDCILSEEEALELELSVQTYKEPSNVAINNVYKEKKKQYRQEHKDYISRQQKEYREKHKEELRKYMSNYYQEHKEDLQSYARTRQRVKYQKNAEAERQRKREYYYRNREKILARLKEKERVNGINTITSNAT